MDIVKAKLDIIFKKLFTSDSDILKTFVCDMLDIPKNEIKKIEVVDPNEYPDDINGKQSQMDLKLTLDNKVIVNVEIQLCNTGSFPDRSLYYWSKAYTDELKKREDYSELKKTIAINIVNFNLFKQYDGWYSKFQLLEEKRHELLTDKCTIIFCELTKLGKGVDKSNRRKLWLQLINAETEEELNMLEQTGVNEINKTVLILRKMSADEKTREIARLREKTMLDERSAINYAKREGIEQGRQEGIEQGRQEGIEQGRQEGIEQGRQQGIEQNRQELIARMKAKGFTDEQISDLLD